LQQAAPLDAVAGPIRCISPQPAVNSNRYRIPDRIARLCRDHDLSEPNTISFIFLRPINDIDFLRRIGECWQRWVVSDIEATFDLTKIDGFAGGG
jgi:hypothetical protein